MAPARAIAPVRATPKPCANAFALTALAATFIVETFGFAVPFLLADFDEVLCVKGR
jgi:hypothetical protein